MPRHVAVIGSGVVGVSTAYALARLGYRITLIDAHAEPGLGASAGNAAQLSYAFGDAMASPALLRNLPAIVAGRQSAIRVKIEMDPDFLKWGLAFMRNMSSRRWSRNTGRVLAIALRSRELMQALVRDVAMDFSYRVAGKLHIYENGSDFHTGKRGITLKQRSGFAQQALTAEEAFELEPALRAFSSPVAGAIFTPLDAVGDAAAFCCELTRHLRDAHSVTCIFGAQVRDLAINRGRVAGVVLRDRRPIECDAAVLATGAESSAFANVDSQTRRVWPIRGYSYTIPAPVGAPMVSLSDTARKIVFARIGDRMRVAGLADIGARGRGFDCLRFAELVKLAHQAAPTLAPAEVMPDAAWSGERPATPDSVPIIEKSRSVSGLYLNIGHGMLGWTLALGSAAQVASLVALDVR